MRPAHSPGFDDCYMKSVKGIASAILLALVIGVIGVSGNTPQEDEDIARAGADSAQAAIDGGTR